jgi:hypothetical protein
MNEPVAWISVLGVDLIGQKFTDVRVSLTKTDVASIPLYAHPVKELTDDPLANFKPVWQEVPAIKELTDEEIIQINKEEGTCWDVPDRFAIQLARAILRKAQE